jgi:hypothetical protein
MIPVKDYKATWDFIKSRVPQIEHFFLVDDESELSKKLKQIADKSIVLIAVIPTTDSQAFDEDNVSDVDTCVIYILQKVNERNLDDDDLLAEASFTQNVLNLVLAEMAELSFNHQDDSKHSIMRNLLRGKTHVDRERNYLSCNGWSLGFYLKTEGFNF